MSGSWLHELSGLIRASQSAVSPIHCEIRVRCGDVVHGIDLASGSISAGDTAASELRGDEASLQSLVRGETTLQAAFRSGKIELNGEPEPFLRLAILLDRSRASSALVC
jgi:hypothetical protein